MKELTLNEIINFSERIEKESYAFYEKAKSIVKDKDANEMVETLAKQEMSHYNQFHILLEGSKISREELDKKVKLDENILDVLVKDEKISENISEKELLEIAFKREEKTRDFYNTMQGMTGINQDVVHTFQELASQEQTHADLIKKRLDRL